MCSSTDVILEDFILSKCKGPALRIANEAFADPFANPEDLEGIPFLITHILHVDFFDNQDKESGFNADGGAIGVSGGSNVTVVDCLFRCDLNVGVCSNTLFPLCPLDNVKQKRGYWIACAYLWQ